MDLIQLAIMLTVAGGIGIATMGLNRLAHTSRHGPLAQISDDLVDFDAELKTPLTKRLVAPLRGRFGRIGRRFTPTAQLESMRRDATLAGVGSRGVETILAVKAIATASGALLVPVLVAVSGSSFGNVVLFGVIGGGMGLLAPGLWISRLAKQRQLQIQRDLPETIDLMAISVQAGMGLEAAVELASQSLPGPLGDELHRLLQEIQLGSSRKEALHHLRDRTQVSELSSFCLALIQADSIGSPIAEVLQSNSARMRLSRRQAAREKAAKLPVKLLLPMMVFIFPALFVVVIGPAAISIIERLGIP